MDLPNENKNKLTSEDIKNLISDSDNFTKLKVFNIFGIQIDIESLIVVIIAIILWTVLWFAFNIFKIISYSEYFFILYIIIILINLLNSATNVPDVETERIQQSSQQSFIQGGIAIFILAFIFLYNIKIDEKYKTEIYRILIISLLVSSLSIIIINVKNNSINIRFVRKMQQMIYNQGLILFILGLFMIYKFKTINQSSVF